MNLIGRCDVRAARHAHSGFQSTTDPGQAPRREGAPPRALQRPRSPSRSDTPDLPRRANTGQSDQVGWRAYVANRAPARASTAAPNGAGGRARQVPTPDLSSPTERTLPTLCHHPMTRCRRPRGLDSNITASPVIWARARAWGRAADSRDTAPQAREPGRVPPAGSREQPTPTTAPGTEGCPG